MMKVMNCDINTENLRDKFEEASANARVYTSMLALEMKAYHECFTCWLMTQPPKWRFKKHREWRDKQPKMEDYINMAKELAEIQISINKIKEQGI